MGDSGVLDEHRLRELIEVGRNLVAELDLESLLERVLTVARRLTGARYAALGVLDSERQGLERFITQGIGVEERRTIGGLPRGRGVLGLLIEQPKPLRLSKVGEHPRSYGFPPGHPPMDSFLGVPILIRGQAWGNLYLTEKRDGDFDAADEQAAIILADWTAIAVENARLYSGLETQRDDLKRAVRGLEATTEISRALGGETNLDRILEMVAKRGRALIEARSLAILLEEDGALRVAAAAGDLSYDEVRRVPLEGSAPGRVLRSSRPERLPTLEPDFLSKPSGQVPGLAGLFVPLVFRGRSFGVVAALGAPDPDQGFTAEDEQMLDAFGVSAAIALSTARSVAEERTLSRIEATERERGRWARELHDEALQSMAGLRVILSTARRGGDEKDQLLSQAVEQVDHTIAEMRRLIADLRPAALDELGLAPALEALIERMIASEALDVELEIDLDNGDERDLDRLVSQIEDTIYRLVQEALNNVGQHAKTDRARVTVREVDSTIKIRVEDEGCGFDPSERVDGYGLLGMQERVSLVGGSLTVESTSGSGTTVLASLPAQRRTERTRFSAGKQAPDEVGELRRRRL